MSVVKIGGCNADFAKGANAHRALVQYLINIGCDVIMLNECKNDVIRTLVPSGWRAVQDVSDPGKAGNAFICRADAQAFPEWMIATRPRIGQRVAKMETRYVMRVRYPVAGSLPLWFLVVHYPPKRFSWLWAQTTGGIRRAIAPVWRRVVIGVDMNQSPKSVVRRPRLRRFKLRAFGGGRIDGLIVGPGVSVRSSHMDFTPKKNGWTDHPAVIMEVMV